MTARVLLVGRPNAGKSSLYNNLTGAEAHVGNFPGVTVEVLEASLTLADGRAVTVLDLPGLYSLESATDPSTDEGVAARLIRETASSSEDFVVVQVLDATQLALNLRLTLELCRKNLPLVLCVSQLDALTREGRTLDAPSLARAVGAPVVAVSARDPGAKTVVLDAAAARLGAQHPTAFCEWNPDRVAREVLGEQAALDDRTLRRRSRTERLDRVLLHPALGPLCFVAIMGALFSAVFLVADPVTAAIDWLVAQAGRGLGATLGAGTVTSLLTDGVLAGAGTVLAFLPQIVVLTLAMELLEGSGYLARGAFLVDRALRFTGLGGRAFVPLLTAHACAVPAITATRILRDPRERLTAILVLPLMTCSARIPTYSLLIAAFFAGRSVVMQAAIFIGLYVFGILSGLVAARVMRKTVTRGRALPLVLEMPAYRVPDGHSVLRQCARAAQRFVIDVGTTILLASVVLWTLLHVPMPGAHDAQGPRPTAVAEATVMQRSVAASVGRALEPVTRPLGFDWRINVGLIGSFGARELMVGTLGVIYGVEDADDAPEGLAARLRDARAPDGTPRYAARTGLSLMAFFVFACQCISTVAAIRRETRTWRWPLFVLGYTYAVAWLAALVAFQGARLLGL